MWIRTQDKTEIINMQGFKVSAIDKIDLQDKDVTTYLDDENGRYTISGLGTYSSKEKALKVLDMIETAIVEYDLGVYIVFQMPEDSEIDQILEEIEREKTEGEDK